MYKGKKHVKRAVHMDSTMPFTCDHTDAVKCFSYPSSEEILTYSCDNATCTILMAGLHPSTDFR